MCEGGRVAKLAIKFMLKIIYLFLPQSFRREHQLILISKRSKEDSNQVQPLGRPLGRDDQIHLWHCTILLSNPRAEQIHKESAALVLSCTLVTLPSVAAKARDYWPFLPPGSSLFFFFCLNLGNSFEHIPLWVSAAF